MGAAKRVKEATRGALQPLKLRKGWESPRETVVLGAKRYKRNGNTRKDGKLDLDGGKKHRRRETTQCCVCYSLVSKTSQQKSLVRFITSVSRVREFCYVMWSRVLNPLVEYEFTSNTWVDRLGIAKFNGNGLSCWHIYWTWRRRFRFDFFIFYIINFLWETKNFKYD